MLTDEELKNEIARLENLKDIGAIEDFYIINEKEIGIKPWRSICNINALIIFEE